MPPTAWRDPLSTDPDFSRFDGLDWRVRASGGHFMFDDDQQTPNALMATFEFPNSKGAAVRGWITNAEDPFWMPKRREASPTAAGIGDGGYMATGAGNAVGNLFFGSKGYMVKNVDEWRTYIGKRANRGRPDRAKPITMRTS